MFDGNQVVRDIDAEMNRLQKIKQLILSTPPTFSTRTQDARQVVRNPMSAAQRKKLSDAQKARWAAVKAARTGQAATTGKGSTSRRKKQQPSQAQ